VGSPLVCLTSLNTVCFRRPELGRSPLLHPDCQVLANSLLTATRIQKDDTASDGPCRALIWPRRTSTDGLFLTHNE
jgi:hypothetical protein